MDELMDPTIADVYRFFLHGYDKYFNDASILPFEIKVGHSINSFVIENEEELVDFLKKYWL